MKREYLVFVFFFIYPNYTHVFAALTPSEHEGALAEAVVIVHVLGAEVGSVYHQTALSACRPTVAFQE